MSLPTVNPTLIRAAQDGTESAWTNLVTAWAPTVLTWCRYQGGGAIDHEDAAHETFIRLHQRIHRLDSPAAFRPFLYAITRRVVSEHRRRAWWRKWASSTPVERVTHEDPERHLQRAQLAREIDATLLKIPIRYREVLIHCDVDGRSMIEAAELLAIPVNTVKSRLSRARQRFRKEAARQGLTLSRITPAPEEEAQHVRA